MSICNKYFVILFFLIGLSGTAIAAALAELTPVAKSTEEVIIMKFLSDVAEITHSKQHDFGESLKNWEAPIKKLQSAYPQEAICKGFISCVDFVRNNLSNPQQLVFQGALMLIRSHLGQPDSSGVVKVLYRPNPTTLVPCEILLSAIKAFNVSVDFIEGLAKAIAHAMTLEWEPCYVQFVTQELLRQKDSCKEVYDLVNREYFIVTEGKRLTEGFSPNLTPLERREYLESCSRTPGLDGDKVLSISLLIPCTGYSVDHAMLFELKHNLDFKEFTITITSKDCCC